MTVTGAAAALFSDVRKGSTHFLPTSWLQENYIDNSVTYTIGHQCAVDTPGVSAAGAVGLMGALIDENGIENALKEQRRIQQI